MENEHIHKEPKLVRPVVNKILIIICLLILINFGLSVYLTYEYFFPSQQSFCAINAVFNCATVAESDYAIFIGIPVAVWGLCYYGLLFIGTLGVVLNFPFWKIHKKLRPGPVLNSMRFLSYFGILFSLYLTYAEAFVINVYCPLCLAQQFFIIVIAGLYIWAHKIINKGKEETKVCEFC